VRPGYAALGVWFLDDPDRLVEIEAIALADTHV
jgi:hypothetical protein